MRQYPERVSVNPSTHPTRRTLPVLLAGLLAVLLILTLTLPAAAQDLDLSVQAPTGDNNPATYALDGGEVSFVDGTVRFLASGDEITGVRAWGVSPGLSVVALTQDAGDAGAGAAGSGSGGSTGGNSSGGSAGTQALVMSASGDTLARYELGQIPAGDESLALFPGDDGSLWVRSNVSTFTGYDVFGRSSLSLSGGSQGSGGATMPQVATDPTGRTLMLYTTQIKTGDGLGSGAQRLSAPGTGSANGNASGSAQRKFESIFYSRDRTIAYADVSIDGQFLVLVTRSEGSEDRVHIMDRYGNTIATVSTEEDLVGANVSGSAEYLVAWSQGRAIVYSTLSGERVRSASFRAPLYHAQYFPEDETIIGLTGNYSERAGILNSTGFYAIDLGAGQIASAELGTPLGFSGSFRPQFRRTGAGSYLLLGASRQVTVRTSF